MSERSDQQWLADELARQCHDTPDAETDLTAAEAAHALRILREIFAADPVRVARALEIDRHLGVVRVVLGARNGTEAGLKCE